MSRIFKLWWRSSWMKASSWCHIDDISQYLLYFNSLPPLPSHFYNFFYFFSCYLSNLPFFSFKLNLPFHLPLFYFFLSVFQSCSILFFLLSFQLLLFSFLLNMLYDAWVYWCNNCQEWQSWRRLNFIWNRIEWCDCTYSSMISGRMLKILIML